MAPTPRRSWLLGLALWAALLIPISGCSLPAPSHPSARAGAATPTAHPSQGGQLLPGVMDDSPTADGWTRLLNGQRFTDGTSVGLVASAARPGRLAGCALPAGAHSAAPRFVLSDDAGATWQAHTVTGASPTSACMLVADAERPDTFVVWANALFYTTDAGVTWHTVPTPAYATPQLTGPMAPNTTILLVNGVLLAQLAPSYRLAELTLGQATTWRWVDSALFALLSAQAPSVVLAGNTEEAFALDPQDPARIYAAMPLGAWGVDIVRSDDSGATWRIILRLPSSARVQLWTAQQHRVFVEDLFDQRPVPYVFFASQDAGVTWHGSLLHGERAAAESVYVSPSGAVLTYYATGGGATPITATLYRLNPTTSAFTTLATDAALAMETSDLGVVTDGPQPQFITISATDTYAYLLPR